MPTSPRHDDEAPSLHKLDKEVGNLTSQFKSFQEKEFPDFKQFLKDRFDELMTNAATKSDLALVKKDIEALTSRVSGIERIKNTITGVVLTVILLAVLALVVKTMPSSPTVEIHSSTH